jgi:hypothetical protein
MLKGDVDAAYRSFSFGLSIRYASRMQNIDKIFLGGLLDLAFPPGLGIGDYLDYHKEGDWIIDTRVSCDIHKNLRIFFIVKNVFNHIYMQRPADMQPPRIFVVQAGFHF